MPTWTITYDDGEEVVSIDVSGKLSLDDSWVFALDQSGPTPLIRAAVPCHRVIEVRLLD